MTMKNMKIHKNTTRRLVKVSLLVVGLLPLSVLAAPPKNVLFIAVDDLRTQLGCYGDQQMVTPAIDRLAKEGVRFEHHYVSHAICIPSRAGLLTGTRSERTHQVYGPALWRDIPGVRTMGATFGAAGYHTVSLGKIWHLKEHGLKADSFNVSWHPLNTARFAIPENLELFTGGKKDQVPIAEGPLDVPDEAYNDGLIARRAVKELGIAAELDKPFMMMVGFMKPHLPLNAPKKYWDLYDADNPPGQPPLELSTLPEGATHLAARTVHELWTYRGGFTYENPPTGAAANRLRHAYAACVSYIDAQIGKVLAELDRLGLRENTIIVLWSDHGWHLGHNGQWTKHTNYETAVNSPLIVSAPGYRRGEEVCAKMVETSDLFPTLLDLTGLPPLKVTDGATLRPLLEDPNSKDWNRVAYHVKNRYHRGSDGVQRYYIGRAVRTDRFRFIEWREGWEQRGEPFAVELYDYSDGAPGETLNLAGNPEWEDECARLSTLLWNWQSQSTGLENGPASLYEAEHAALTGVNVGTTRAGYTGTGHTTQHTFDASGDQIEFTVRVPAAGNYRLAIRYNAPDRKINFLDVNGKQVAELDFPGTDDTWQTYEYGEVGLNDGVNTITLRKSWGWMDVDYIEIARPLNNGQ